MSLPILVYSAHSEESEQSSGFSLISDFRVIICDFVI
jgi:hypothetical protein